jgi:hypothetical protein
VVVSAIYDRQTAFRTDANKPPPLAKWGMSGSDHYLRDISLGERISVSVLNMPLEYWGKGLLAWSSIGHEIGGHVFLNSNRGLIDELRKHIFRKISEKGGLNGEEIEYVPGYWAACVEEAASDVLGVLNIGPAMGVGFIGFSRGKSTNRKLDSSDPPRYSRTQTNLHPMDVLRSFVHAFALRLMGREEWAVQIEALTCQDIDKDRNIFLCREGDERWKMCEITMEKLRNTAFVVTEVIATTGLESLGGRSLISCFTWSDMDERFCEKVVRVQIAKPGMQLEPLPSFNGENRARHILAAAILEAVKGGSDIDRIFLK